MSRRVAVDAYAQLAAEGRLMGAATLSVEPARAGLVAFNQAGGSTDLDAAFDYFRIESEGDPLPLL